jgi:hypothetical protein
MKFHAQNHNPRSLVLHLGRPSASSWTRSPDTSSYMRPRPQFSCSTPYFTLFFISEAGSARFGVVRFGSICFGLVWFDLV